MSASQNHPAEPRTIGILGAARVGTAVGRQALKAGYDVMVATSKPADDIALMVQIMTPGAVAVTAAEATEADIVVVAVPLYKYRTLAPALLAGKTVIEAMNYWAPVDGGPLRAGRSFQPGTEIFNGSHTAQQLRSILAADRAPARP